MELDQRTFDALCRNDLSVFFQRAWREVEPAEYCHNWHIDCIAAHLEAVERGEIRRLIINVPPRTGKTLLVNICFPAWVMGRNDGTKIVGVSFAHRLSEKISFQQRRLMQSKWFCDLFPALKLDPNQQSKSNFTTLKGGGRFSTSVGGTLTGEGGDIIVVDDPADPKSSLSDVERININEWIDQTLFTRLNNPRTGRIVLIQQRLHGEDTTGHLLKKGNWHHLVIPAETDQPYTIKLGDKEWHHEGLLHAERMSRQYLDEQRHAMGSYAYAGQYLQVPVPRGGGEIKADYINYFPTLGFNARGSNIYITVDPANSKKKTSDYTAMVVWALAPDQNYYLVDGIRERLNPTERIDRLFALHRKWNTITGKPPRVGYERYGMMSDTHYIAQKQAADNYRFHVEEIRSGMQKEERIRRLIPIMEQRRVWLPSDIMVKNAKGLPENFIDDIVKEEMLLFPYAAHDDFLDAMSMIFDMNPLFPRVGSVERVGNFDYMNSGGRAVSVLDM